MWQVYKCLCVQVGDFIWAILTSLSLIISSPNKQLLFVFGVSGFTTQPFQ